MYWEFQLRERSIQNNKHPILKMQKVIEEAYPIAKRIQN